MLNAKVLVIPNVMDELAKSVHGNCTKSILHQTSASELSVFTVLPGESLVSHSHPHTWDLFFGISGTANIHYESDDDSGVAVLNPRSLCAMPPKVIHQVQNASDSVEVSFLLIHAPWEGYEFLKENQFL